MQTAHAWFEAILLVVDRNDDLNNGWEHRRLRSADGVG